MQEFTGWEYLLIDVANNYGLDKLTFEERLMWATEMLPELEIIGESREDWKQKPMYLKTVSAIRKAQQGLPSGHPVSFDAVCSGMQLMSVLTGCTAGATATGLVDPDRRADAYTDCTKLMSEDLGYHLPGERDKVKNAVMTSLYGSKKEPKKEFGNDTPELDAFYKAMLELAPGACDLLETLVNSWQPFALSHSWKLPDGFDAYIKVMEQKKAKVEVDELNHSTFTYVYYENEGKERDVKNAANVIHSIDAYVLRSLLRRCSYDRLATCWAESAITLEMLSRSLGETRVPRSTTETDEPHLYYIAQWERSSVADVVILPYLNEKTVQDVPTALLKQLNHIIATMLDHEPFPVITVHDDFRCHPNHANHMRKHYRNILAELADSTLLDDLLSQLFGVAGTFDKQSSTLSDKILLSNYALT